VDDGQGNALGVMPTSSAQQMAENRNMDLVLIQPNANPPVCKIMDYGKFRFETLRKEKDNKKNQKVTELKDIWLSATIDVGDLETKSKHARKFIQQNNKVRLSIRMKGRQQAHPKISMGIMADFFAKVEDIAVMEKPPLQEGRSITMIIAPAKETKAKSEEVKTKPEEAKTKNQEK